MSQDRGSIQFGQTTLTYRVVHSPRRKTLAILVDAQTGIEVRVPPGTADQTVQEAVRRKAAWLVQKLEPTRATPAKPIEREYVTGESFSLLGRQYRLEIKTTNLDSFGRAYLRGRFIAVEVQRYLDEEARRATVRAALEGLCRRTALDRLPGRIGHFARNLGLAMPEWSLADQDKRWGSCSTSGHLRFNWRLMMAPIALVDYVIAHEVCHLVHADHGTAFWALLRSVMPDYEQRKGRLAEEGRRFSLGAA